MGVASSEVLQQSRPVSRQDMHKRKSVRNGMHQSLSTLDQKPRLRRPTRHSNNMATSGILQMSISEFGDDPTSGELPPIKVTEEDPLTLSPDSISKYNDDSPGDGTKKKNIYGLGILSSAHLDKQPKKASPGSNKASASPISPGEIVKVQFVQSGGKVIPVSQLQASISNGLGGIGGIGSADPSRTPQKAKKKLQSLLSKVTGGGTSKVSSATRTRTVASKYQTFDDDDGEHEPRRFDVTDEDDEDDDIDNDNVTSASAPLTSSRSKGSWDAVDAAIPVLQL